MIGVFELVRHRVREPVRKLIKGRRIDWGIEKVQCRVLVPFKNSLGVEN